MNDSFIFSPVEGNEKISHIKLSYFSCFRLSSATHKYPCLALVTPHLLLLLTEDFKIENERCEPKQNKVACSTWIIS